MIKKFYRPIVVLLIASALSACSGFFDSDNTPPPTPLNPFSAEVKPKLLWSVKTGSGAGDDYLRFTPTTSDNLVFTSDNDGEVSATDKVTGRTRWHINTNRPISTAVGAGDNIVVVGTRKGNVIALRESDGSKIWQVTVKNEILATPVITQGKVIIKTVDGHVYGLSVENGQQIWSFTQTEPALMLRSSSTPQVSGHHVIIGFANGNIIKLNSANGIVSWQQAVAIPQGSFAIQRMIDVDADPVIFHDRLYAATYQGKISAMELSSGVSMWSHDISSYTGLTATPNQVFITDAKSIVWSFDASNGFSNWRQTQLGARNITAPAKMGDTIVVGDGEGYLHWLSQKDGHFVGRAKVSSAAIIANPVVENGILYIVTQDGFLAAYKL